MAKKHPDAVIQNRRVRYDYDLRDEFSVGIVLSGQEVKAARGGQVSLNSKPGTSERTVETGARKLLAKKKEITALAEAKDQGLTIVPLSMTTRTRFIKLKIATAKGKKQYDKRETIKRRDQERETKRLLAQKIN